jgi:transposase InsO family protein
LLRPPGPKKTEPPDWQALHDELAALPQGRSRTLGTTRFHQDHVQAVSRRQVRQLAAQIRQDKIDHMKRVQWHCPGLAWAIDATEYGPGPWKITPMQDLCSRYRFVPLLTRREDGHQIAAYLDAVFLAQGAPLLLKRDNGSPFNHEAVDQVLQRHGVLSLNSPPRYPPYNGAMEKGIGDLKRQLDRRLQPDARVCPNLRAQVEAVVHDLNHRPKRLLQGRTPCDVFHDQCRRLRLSKKERTKIFHLLLQIYWRTIGNMPNRTRHQTEAAWRLTVESWLVCQGLISIRLNKNPKVSTSFPKNWSHN